MDTGSVTVQMKTVNIYNDFAEDAEKKLALQIMTQADRCLKEKVKE